MAETVASQPNRSAAFQRARLGETYIDGSFGVFVQTSAITDGPHVEWRHVDGPLMTWASHLHWLTLSERVRIWVGLTTVDRVACSRWPRLAVLRAFEEARASLSEAR
jgi:hypothetical protein